MGNANPIFAHLRNCIINVFCNDVTTPAKNQTVKDDPQLCTIPSALGVPRDTERARLTSQ
jgi:hypothetical protein